METRRQVSAEGDDRSEESLVRRAVAGDADAFADLYETHLNRIFRYCYYRVGSREDAEDLTEQVFLKAWQALPRYDVRGTPFAAWLARIAHNSTIDYRRTARPTTPIDDSLEILDSTRSPEEIAEQRLEAQELAEAIGQLSSIEQSVLALRFVNDLDHKTVARIIDKSVVATRTIQSRALARLGRLLKSRGGGGE